MLDARSDIITSMHFFISLLFYVSLAFAADETDPAKLLQISPEAARKEAFRGPHGDRLRRAARELGQAMRITKVYVPILKNAEKLTEYVETANNGKIRETNLDIFLPEDIDFVLGRLDELGREKPLTDRRRQGIEAVKRHYFSALSARARMVFPPSKSGGPVENEEVAKDLEKLNHSKWMDISLIKRVSSLLDEAERSRNAK